jgi:dCTP deaminase
MALTPTSGGAFWSGETLREWVPRFNMIEPFDARQIDCAAYTLRMGREAYITPDYKVRILPKHTIYRLEDEEHFIVPAGQFGFLLTEEVIYIPNHVIGFISLRTHFKFHGLINVSGFHVDPGFRGHLIYAVYNAGPSQIHLSRGMELFKIWFAQLDRYSEAIRHQNVHIENTRIEPSLISSVQGPIFSQQNLSMRIERLDRRLFRIEAVAGAAVVILGLLFAALKLDAIKTFLGIS